MPGKNDLDKVSELLELFRLEKILLLMLGFIALVFFAKKLKNASSILEKRYPNLRLTILQISTILTFAWYIIGFFLIVYGVLRPSKEVLLALGGSAAVAIGLSLKDIAASLIAGIVLLFDRPFQVGDKVKFNEIYGEITHIGLRAVRLVTLDDNLVTIPNSQFINNAVSSGNAGALDMMIEIKFHLSLDEDIVKMKEILHEIVITSRYAYLKKPVKVVVSEEIIGSTLALMFNVKAYVFDVHFEKDFSTDIVTRAYQVFQKLEVKRPQIYGSAFS